MPFQYVCIHAHFYQPPRENPWLEKVEKENSAAPFHDWNQRITRECYAANGASRILKEKRIAEIVNNYEKISFNFGPTLLSWMERREPVVYRKIIESDRKSSAERNGHGNAIAQVYSHSIMPLNSARDKETQIIWGIRDFEHRFGRKPEGLWFAETAVDRESLFLSVKHGIRFTILSPGQAKSIRPLEPGAEWEEVKGNLDATRPYIFKPDENTEIGVFFYDGGLAHSVAFGDALTDGVRFGKTLIQKAVESEKSERLVHIATDGETFGHHHKFGEMALSSTIKTIEERKDVRLTNYGEFLASHPPVMEVEIDEKSSWSCVHGVERWRSGCGCTTGGEKGWNQKWRAGLREAFDRLKSELDSIFETEASKYIESPWEARDGYIDVLLKREKGVIDSFISSYASRPLSDEEVTHLLKLMEMQTAAMKMFTSCGWFFSDISGLETLQVMKYAAKAIGIAEEYSSLDLEGRLIKDLEKAKSNILKNGTGADLYNSRVKPLILDPMRVIARTAILDSLDLEEERTSLYCYTLEVLDKQREEDTDMSMTVGRITLTSTATLEKKDVEFCLLHFGGHDFDCAIRPFVGEKEYTELKDELVRTFREQSVPEIIHLVEKHFHEGFRTFEALFEDERKAAMERLTSDLTSQVGKDYEELFEKHRRLMEYFLELKVPVPDEIRIAAKYVFEKRTNSLFSDISRGDDHKVLSEILKDAEKWGVRLGIKQTKENILRYLKEGLEKTVVESGRDYIPTMVETVNTLNRHKIRLDTWEMENELYPYYLASKDPSHILYPLVSSKKGFKELLKIFNFYL